MNAVNSCGIKTSNGPKSFKYGPSDLSSDHPMPIRGIPLTPHQSTRTMVIPSHGMTAYQHHSDVVLQSQGTSLMRCNTTCLPGLFPCLTRTVCSISLTDGCTVTCRAFFRLYCWRVRSFRFFLASDGYCWVTVAGESNCGGACDVGGIAEDGLALDSVILLFILSFIALISSLKLFTIACRAFIVTDIPAVWVVDMLNNRNA